MIFLGSLSVIGGVGLFFAARLVSPDYWGWTGRVRAYVGAVCLVIIGIIVIFRGI